MSLSYQATVLGEADHAPVQMARLQVLSRQLRERQRYRAADLFAQAEPAVVDALDQMIDFVIAGLRR